MSSFGEDPQENTCNDAAVRHRWCWDSALLCPALGLEALREFSRSKKQGIS